MKHFCSLKTFWSWFLFSQVRVSNPVRKQWRLAWRKIFNNNLRTQNPINRIEAYIWVISICLKYVSLPWNMVNSLRRGASEPWAWRDFYNTCPNKVLAIFPLLMAFGWWSIAIYTHYLVSEIIFCISLSISCWAHAHGGFLKMMCEASRLREKRAEITEDL